MKRTNNNAQKIFSEIERIYNCLNSRFFSSNLPCVMFEFTMRKSVTTIDETRSPAVILIPLGLIQDDIEPLLLFLFHQMIHLYCHVNNIKESSRQSRYHNENFKVQAEKHGLIVKEYRQSTGYSETIFSDELRKDCMGFVFLDKWKYLIKDFDFDDMDDISSFKKLKCFGCGRMIFAPPNINVICGFCLGNFCLVTKSKKKRNQNNISLQFTAYSTEQESCK